MGATFEEILECFDTAIETFITVDEDGLYDVIESTEALKNELIRYIEERFADEDH